MNSSAVGIELEGKSSPLFFIFTRPVKWTCDRAVSLAMKVDFRV